MKAAGWRTATWRTAAWRSAVLFVVLTAAAFGGHASLPGTAAHVVGGLALAVGSAYSLCGLLDLTHGDRLPRRLRAALLRLGALRSPP